MSFSILFCRTRPDLCWIGLFSLNFWHLSQRMLFARRRKQEDAKRNTDDALANERSHNALAQLSVSAAARKAESVGVVATFVSNARRSPRRAPPQKIERRRCEITITCGGPHRKTQRVERSIRSRSPFCRHATVFRADFLYAEGYTVVALV